MNTDFIAIGSPWLVVKYAVNGCLVDYLKENRYSPIYNNLESIDNIMTITPGIKLSFAYDIAKGMSHLEKNRVSWASCVFTDKNVNFVTH